jgi:hypothetical protein
MPALVVNSQIARIDRKKAAHPRGLLPYISNGISRPRPEKITYPAARRLSAEDLPERRSATIS